MMDMSINWKSNYVLESVKDGSVSNRPLIEASVATRRYMWNDETDFSILFHLGEQILEPL